MSTIKVKLRKSSIEGQPGSIVYVVTHKRLVRIYTTEYHLYSHEWDCAKSQVVVPKCNRTDICASIAQFIRLDIERLEEIIINLSSLKSDYSSDDIIQKFREQSCEQWFFKFMNSVAMRMKQIGKIGTAKNYCSTLNSLMAFREGKDIVMQEITTNLVEEYQAWLTKRDVKPNSISFYMRILRATYLRAVEKGLVADKRPFKHAYTKIEKTVKRAISIVDIKRIKDLELTCQPSLELARDIFLFLFYTRGMSFIDAAYLSKANIHGTEIIYRRHKTQQLLVIGVNHHIEQLLSKYASEQSPYLLPIILSKNNERAQYESALRRINNSLKEIAKLANIYANLTTYTARHSWATIAKQKGIATATISDALGHDSEKTTQIYLASISTSEINKANDLVLSFL